jgi:hypothetical protein
MGAGWMDFSLARAGRPRGETGGQLGDIEPFGVFTLAQQNDPGSIQLSLRLSF